MLVRGIVKDLFIVKSKKNISIGKLVEAAYLFADEDIEIFGGVKGREKAILAAKGNITAKFLEYVYLEAGGNVEISKQAMDSSIVCQGRLDIKNGSLIAGQSYACQGAIIKSLGSPSGVKTIIGIASNPFVFHRLFEIDQQVETEKQKIEKIRISVAPLMQQLKRLTPEQREKATELMYMADSLESENTNRHKEKEELLASMPDPNTVELTVLSKILPNTEVRIGNRYTTIKEEIKGPVKILLRKIEGVTEMVQVSQSSGSVHTFKSRKLDISSIELPQKPEIAQPGTENKDISEGTPNVTKCADEGHQSSE